MSERRLTPEERRQAEAARVADPWSPVWDHKTDGWRSFKAAQAASLNGGNTGRY